MSDRPDVRPLLSNAPCVPEGTWQEDADPGGGQRPAAAPLLSTPRPHGGGAWRGPRGVPGGGNTHALARRAGARGAEGELWQAGRVGACVHAGEQSQGWGVRRRGTWARCVRLQVLLGGGLGARARAKMRVHMCRGGRGDTRFIGAGACVYSRTRVCGAGDVPHGTVWALGAVAPLLLWGGTPLLPPGLAAASGPKVTALQEALGVLGERSAGDGSKGFVKAGSILGVSLL